MYMQNEGEYEPVRILESIIEVDGAYYKIKLITSMVEEDNQIETLFFYRAFHRLGPCHSQGGIR